MRRWQLTILFCFGSYAISSNAQYRLLPGNVDADGFPITAARICLGSTETTHCYTPPNYMKGSPFGLDPKAQTIGKLDERELTLFTATFSGGGSGTLTNLALLTVRSGEFVNLLPKVQLTNQSEYKTWDLPQLSSLPVLVTADFVWDFKAAQSSNFEQETHFAHHRYTVRAFRFETKTHRYIQQAEYITTKKYPGLDEVDEIHVLDAEKKIILAKLKQAPAQIPQ